MRNCASGAVANWSWLVGFCLLLCTGSGVHCQPIAPMLHDPDSLGKLQGYFRDRLLQIAVTVISKSHQTEEVKYGTGFLVSPDGYAITARHVLEPGADYDVLGYKIQKAEGASGLVELDLVSDDYRLSNIADVALFRVKYKNGFTPEKYMCVEFDENNVRDRGKVDVVSWRFFAGGQGWTFVSPQEYTIMQANGPNRNFEYWGLDKPIDRSMSGGPVLQNDRVVAVISNTLSENGAPIAGGNYANPLRYASDLGLSGRAKKCSSAVPDEVNVLRHSSRENFYRETCEGTPAWAQKSNGYHWSLPRSGNYRVSRDDLSCDPKTCFCDGERPDKSIRLVFNHVGAPNGRANGRVCPSVARTASKTFYGLQVFPVFYDSTTGTNEPSLWLFRTRSLYERKADGSFMNSGWGKEAKSVYMSPSEYNDALTDAYEMYQSEMSGSCRAIPPQVCSDIRAVSKFNKVVRSASVGLTSFHGYPDAGAQSKSTLSPLGRGRLWRTPDDWRGVQNKELKNFIIRYTPSDEPKTAAPVDVTFCVAASWKEFYFRAFSPDRGVWPSSYHVYLD